MNKPNYRRLKLTLILLMLLFAGKYVKADTPCHVAITSYERQIDSLENRLKTAQSVPYNQGYQEGYKVAKLQDSQAKYMILAVVAGIWLAVCFIIYLNYKYPLS